MAFAAVISEELNSLETAPNVFGKSDRLKMRRVDAPAIAAQMIQGQTGGNWPNKGLVGKTVGHYAFSICSVKTTVAIGGNGFGPVPTASLIDTDAAPDLSLNCFHVNHGNEDKP